MGIMVPPLLGADDLILMSESTAGLQKQLDATASFCEQRQLAVILSKTKVVALGAQRSNVPDFVLDSTLVERVDSYKYPGFVFGAAQGMQIGTALFAIWRRCQPLRLRDPAKQCKLFDTFTVLPILSYACEVWGFSPSVGVAAEVLHRGFLRLKHLLGVRISTVNEIVLSLAEFGCFPLQIHFWQHTLRHHHRT